MQEITRIESLKSILSDFNKYRYISIYDLAEKESILTNTFLTGVSIGSKKKGLSVTISYRKSSKLFLHMESDFEANSIVLVNDSDPFKILALNQYRIIVTSEPFDVDYSSMDGQGDLRGIDFEAYKNSNIHGKVFPFYGKNLDSWNDRIWFDNYIPITSHRDLKNILSTTREYTYITAMSLLPKKEIIYFNTLYMGYEFEKSAIMNSQADTHLVFLNEFSVRGNDLGNPVDIRYRKNDFKLFNVIFHRLNDVAILIFNTAAIVFHNYHLLNIDFGRLLKGERYYRFELSYYDTFVVKYLNGKTSVDYLVLYKEFISYLDTLDKDIYVTSGLISLLYGIDNDNAISFLEYCNSRKAFNGKKYMVECPCCERLYFLVRPFIGNILCDNCDTVVTLNRVDFSPAYIPFNVKGERS